MKFKTYNIVEMCVEVGIERGLNRADRKTVHSAPSLEELREHVYNAVMESLLEYINFEESA